VITPVACASSHKLMLSLEAPSKKTWLQLRSRLSYAKGTLQEHLKDIFDAIIDAGYISDSNKRCNNDR